MESIIAKKIREHLDKHNLINGFADGKSCFTNFLSFCSKVYEAMNSGESYDMFYLDFSTEFHKIPHQRLLKKIRARRIHGKILEWIKAWLNVMVKTTVEVPERCFRATIIFKYI